MLRRTLGNPKGAQAGMTLLELILACAILLVLSSVALPMARYSLTLHKEGELRRALLDIREGIDRYKDAADHQQIRTAMGSDGYPPDLQTLVKGVPLGNTGDKKIRFLRQIPVDPMTGKADWGLRGSQDDWDSKNWGGNNVFDVYSLSSGMALDGTRYSDW